MNTVKLASYNNNDSFTQSDYLRYQIMFASVTNILGKEMSFVQRSPDVCTTCWCAAMLCSVDLVCHRYKRCYEWSHFSLIGT